MLSDRFHLCQECRAEIQKQEVGPTYSLYIQQILPVSCLVKLHSKPTLINMESIVEFRRLFERTRLQTNNPYFIAVRIFHWDKLRTFGHNIG